jgi:hypothetical protein
MVIPLYRRVLLLSFENWSVGVLDQSRRLGEKWWIHERLNPFSVGKFVLLAVIPGIAGNFSL